MFTPIALYLPFSRGGVRTWAAVSCRRISRPVLSENRLSPTANGHVRYRFKTPWRDGTTEPVPHPLDFLARLAALVSKPRVDLARFHGVFAPNSRPLARLTPARLGSGRLEASTIEGCGKNNPCGGGAGRAGVIGRGPCRGG